MAKAHPAIDTFIKYLREGFALKDSCDLQDSLGETFSYEKVKSAFVSLKKTDPELHRLLSYLWQSKRKRNTIAEHLYIDSSTLRRKWVTGILILLNYLVNEEITEDIGPIDLIQKLNYE